METKNNKNFSWPIFWYELLGTGLLLLIGLSLVTVMFGTGSPIVKLIPYIGYRRLITGFLFGSTGALIAISPIGKVSGAHINPVVTMAFLLFKKIDMRTALSYISGSICRCRDWMLTTPGLGWDGPECGFWCHNTRPGLFTVHGFAW